MSSFINHCSPILSTYLKSSNGNSHVLKIIHVGRRRKNFQEGGETTKKDRKIGIALLNHFRGRRRRGNGKKTEK